MCLVAVKNNSMRKLFVYCLSASVVFFGSCSDDPDPLQAEKNGVLLAGKKGQSKSWKLVSLTEKFNTSAAEPLALSGCFVDNDYTFSNTDEQRYESTEGATVCEDGDPDLAEAGSWAFSIDGKTLIISGDEIYSQNGGLFSGLGYLFQFFPFPCAVSTLTEDDLVLSITLKDTEDTIVYTLTFEPS